MSNMFATCYKCEKEFPVYEGDNLYFDIKVEGNSASTANLCPVCAMKKTLKNERIFHTPFKTVYVVEKYINDRK